MEVEGSCRSHGLRPGQRRGEMRLMRQVAVARFTLLVAASSASNILNV